MDRLTKSDKTFLSLVLLMLLGKAVWTYSGVDHPIVQNWTGAWQALILLAFFGFIAIKLAEKTGFPDVRDEKISNKERFFYPVLPGFAFAVIEILVGLAMDLPNIHVPFPFSIPVYLSGGIFLEIIYLLIPTVFLVWLISNLLLKGKRQEEGFVVVAVLASLWEQVMQITGMYRMGMLTGMLFGAGLFIFIFAGNLTPHNPFPEIRLPGPGSLEAYGLQPVAYDLAYDLLLSDSIF